MSCNFTEKISSLIDGELTTAEEREIERHLLNCSECEQLRADFLNLRSQIAGFESSLEPAVQNRALKKILAPERRTPAHGLQWSFGTQAVAFATLLIVGAIIGLALYQTKKTNDPGNIAVVQPSPAPSASVEKNPAPEASPEPPRKAEEPAQTKDEKESNTPRKPSAPVKNPRVREPKPGEQFAAVPVPERVRSADTETMTAMHFEKS